MNNSIYKNNVDTDFTYTIVFILSTGAQKSHIRIKFSRDAAKCRQTLSRTNHAHFPHKLPITVYGNIHIYTNKIKNKGAEGKYKKDCLS